MKILKDGKIEPCCTWASLNNSRFHLWVYPKPRVPLMWLKRTWGGIIQQWVPVTECPNCHAKTEVEKVEMTPEELASLFHAYYEEEAVKHGWKTQEETRVPFDSLPERNRDTMISTCKRILEVKK